MKIEIASREDSEEESFYATLGIDCRFTVPKIVAEELELEPGDILYVVLNPL